MVKENSTFCYEPLIRVHSNNHKSRINLLLYLAGFVFLVLVLRIFGLQIIQSHFYKKLAEKNIIKIVLLPQNRGEFVDRNGVLLAGNVPDYILEVYLYLIKNRKQTVHLLSEISLISEKEIDKKLTKAKSFYTPVKLKRHLTISEIAKIVENITELPGVTVKRKPLRDYRYGKITSHLIGFTGEITELELKERPELKEGDIIGKSGLEKLYGSYLRGNPGFEYIEVDAKGREIGVFNQMKSIQPEPGAKIRLTIDINLQKMADTLLMEYTGGSVVAINPQNGDVLVLYSKPGFDPNVLVRGISYEGLRNIVFAEGSSFWNRATMSIYPPGSIFKIVVAAIALENRIINADTKLRNCSGCLRIGNRNFHCWKKHGILRIHKALVQSCDVFFYQVGMKLGFSNLEKGIRKLRFFGKTDIDLPEEKSGFFPDRNWYKKKYDISFPTKGMVANLSIGQGEVLVTPLGMCNFFCGIANHGYIMTPHLVRQIEDVSGNTLFKSEIKKRKIPISKETLKFLREAMLGVVNENGGTGVLSRIKDIKVAGKTGTAENPHGDDHAWFVAFAPYEKPEICIVVMVENAGHGGSIAAPIAREIIKRALE
ncbi:MAG: penicillin-binding protein 2 [Candidatus Cloacimonadota bacterium]|nr:MAG: penicillin-binding protein 2 [Candidatus Cloacimonadota bacterium]